MTMPENLLQERILHPAHQVISFDVFDTLLQRPVVRPGDLFRIMGLRCGRGTGYAERRRAAEKAARDALPAPREDVTLAEIYHELCKAGHCSEKEKNTLYALELEVEREYLRPRKGVGDAFHLALEHGKKVVLCSDMYLPEAFLESVLHDNGYAGYHKLYLSSSLGLRKNSGNLYRYMLNDLALPSAESVLHVGDNMDSDIQAAQALGMHTVHVPRALDLFKTTRLGQELYSFYEKEEMSFYYIGTVANALFGDPYAEYGREPLLRGGSKTETAEANA